MCVALIRNNSNYVITVITSSSNNDITDQLSYNETTNNNGNDAHRFSNVTRACILDSPFAASPSVDPKKAVENKSNADGAYDVYCPVQYSELSLSLHSVLLSKLLTD